MFSGKGRVNPEKLNKHFEQVLHVGGQAEHDFTSSLVGNCLQQNSILHKSQVDLQHQLSLCLLQQSMHADGNYNINTCSW